MQFALLSALSLAAAAAAQAANVTIQVGGQSSSSGGVFQYIPNNITASNGTVVTFRFSGNPGNHTVTQSTFASPCNPEAGGFDSGWVFVPGGETDIPEWNLTITDDTKPIWFYCKQLLPSPHCIAGMVGSINAPSTGNTFAAFQANAKNATSSGQGVGGLVGIGASASALVGPVTSGVSTFGSPTGATGSGTAASGTDSSESGSGSAATPTSSSGASHVAASSIFVLFGAALGLAMA